MDDFLQEIEQALENNLFFVALQATLALPDICGALQSDDSVGKRYKEWFNQYGRKHTYSRMTAEDCYYFRCSMLHQASTVPSPYDGEQLNYTRILFVVEPECLYHNNVINGALNIDLHIFCRGIIAGVREWQRHMEETQNEVYAKKYSQMIRVYMEGLAPYTQGLITIT